LVEATKRSKAICFNLVQNCARHTGHLDVFRELIDGTVGE
jgi:hypothetical protein